MNKPFHDALAAIDKQNWRDVEKIIDNYPYIINNFDNNGNNILLLALQKGCDISFFDFLHSWRCNFNLDNSLTGESPLFLCTNFMLDEQVRWLQKHGACMSPYEEALVTITIKKDFEHLEWLMKNHRSLSYLHDTKGWNLLHHAVHSEANIKYIKILCRYIDNCAVSFDRISVLGSVNVVVQPSSPSQKKSTPELLEVFDFLQQSGAKMLREEQLQYFIWNYDIDNVKKIIHEFPELIYTYYHNELPALNSAVIAGRWAKELPLALSMIEFLLSCGTYVDIPDAVRSQTSLFDAYYSNEISRLLISKGAQVNARDNNGNTPLHIAMLNIESWPQALLEAGADINAVNNFMRTPYDSAEQYLLPDYISWRNKLRKMGGRSGQEIIP